MVARDGLTVCSLVLPILDLPALLVGLGPGVRRTIAGLFRFALGPRELSHGMSHRPDYRMPHPVYWSVRIIICRSEESRRTRPGPTFGARIHRSPLQVR